LWFAKSKAKLATDFTDGTDLRGAGEKQLVRIAKTKWPAFSFSPEIFTPAVLSVSKTLEDDRPLISLFGEGQYQT
jgi:hypothetical protein